MLNDFIIYRFRLSKKKQLHNKLVEIFCVMNNKKGGGNLLDIVSII